MTEPVSAEEPDEKLVCTCGSPDHEPLRVGVAFSVSGPERGLFDCPDAATHRYGLGPVS